MKISIQRQCDGRTRPHADYDCSERMEVTATVSDPKDKESRAMFVHVWESLAAKSGWRRVHSRGVDVESTSTMDETVYVIPSVKTWVVCPGCAEVMDVICGQCRAKACACTDGPMLDAIPRST